MLARYQDKLASDTEAITAQRYFDINPCNNIKGVSNKLEKQYLRLTSAPNPSQIRPLQVLKKALEHVLTMHVSDPDDYAPVCEQFKSIRQDLKVQGINNRFAAHVYETHARIALQCGDLEGIYNIII